MHKAIRGDKAAGAFGAVAVLACCCGFLVLQVACGEAGLNETASETVQSLRLGEESPSLDEAAPFSVRCATPLHSIVYPGITEAIGHVVLDIQKDAIGSASDASVFASIRVNGPSSDSAIYLAEASFDIPQETADGQSSVSMPIEIRWSGLDANGQPIPPDQLLDLSADLELRVLGRDTDSAGSVGSATVVFQVRTRDPSTYSRRAILLEQLVRSAEVARACATESPDNDVAAELSGLPQSGLPMALDERGFLRKLGGPRTSLPMDASEAGIDLEPAQVARSFIDTYKELFGIGEPRVELLHESTRSVQNGAIVHFSQLSSQGLPVFDGQVFVYVNPEGSIREIRSSANAVGTFDLSAAVPGEESTSFALGYLNAAGICLNALTNGEPTLGVMTLDSCAPKLVWQTLFDCLDGDSYTVYVDAFDGRILNCRPRSLSVGPYQIRYLDPPPEYVPGTLVYEYPSGYTHPLGFGAFLDTFRLNQHTFTTLDYYGTRFGRDGWDDGQIPEGHVAVTQANWPGISGCFPCQFPYGRVAINHADVCLDVVAHEYGHLVAIADIGGYSQLYWQHQAISEGMSDFVGEMTEAFLVGTPDWIVGTELDQSTDNCSPYRSLSDPTSDNPVSPSHWNDSGQTIESHQQSGPLRKAGWLMGRETAEGWASFAGIGATGIGAVDAGVLWYETQRERLVSVSDFRDFREEMIDYAFSTMFYNQIDKAVSVRNALDSVGIFSNTVVEPIVLSAAPAVSSFSVNGQSRKYMHYSYPTGPGSGLLYQVFRTCALTGSCGWSTPTQVATIDPGSGPASVVLGGYLWVFAKSPLSNDLKCYRLSPSGVWSACTGFTSFGIYPKTDHSPSATVFSGKIFLVFKAPGAGSQMLKFRTYNPSTGSWSSVADVGSMSISAPSVTGPLGLRFYLVFDGGSGPKYRSYYSSGWSPVEATSPITTGIGDPAAAVFRNRLHIAQRDSSGGLVLYASRCFSSADGCTYRPGEWTSAVKQDDLANGLVGILPDTDGKLYFFVGVQEYTLETYLGWTSKYSE